MLRERSSVYEKEHERFPKSKTQFIVLKADSDLEKSVNELKKLGIQGLVDKNKIDPKQFALEVKGLLK